MSDPRFSDPIYASGYLDGITNEQERIIKLLEAVATEVNRAIIFDSSKSDDLNRQKIAAVCYHLIPLIKGEQK